MRNGSHNQNFRKKNRTFLPNIFPVEDFDCPRANDSLFFRPTKWRENNKSNFKVYKYLARQIYWQGVFSIFCDHKYFSDSYDIYNL